MKSGNLNFLELSGPLQACNGTALLFGDLHMAKLTALTFYCLHNVSTLHQSWKAPCVIMYILTLSQYMPVTSLDHSRLVTGLFYLYITVHIQLSCVPNRPCCFRNFGIQRHFVWSIEQQQWRTKEFISGGDQEIHLWTEDRPLPLPLYFTKKDVIRVLCLFHLD